MILDTMYPEQDGQRAIVSIFLETVAELGLSHPELLSIANNQHLLLWDKDVPGRATVTNRAKSGRPAPGSTISRNVDRVTVDTCAN